MDSFTREDLKGLLKDRPAPCLSLFMPAHRGGAEQDPIRWRNHLTAAEERLTATGLRAPEAREFLKPAVALLEDASFWKNQSDGLAFFLAEGFNRAYRLPVTFADLLVVGKHFHVKPLLPLLGEDGRFFVLALSHNVVRLLECTRDRWRPVALDGAPANFAEAMRTHDSDESMQFHGRLGASGAGGGKPVFYSHGGDIDQDKEEVLRYFQMVDRGLGRVLKVERAPVVLAAVGHLMPLYRQASSAAHLFDEGIEGNPDRLSDRELHDRAWEVVRASFEKPPREALALYRQLAGTGRTAHDLREVVTAAYEGQVEVLFVARDREQWGRFDPAGPFLDLHEKAGPGDEDVLNVAASHTLRHGQAVHAVNAAEVPDGGPAAAIYRLPLAKRGKRP